MTNRKTTADYFKQVGVDLNTYKVNPNKKFKKSTTPGLKKGSGGIDSSGLSAGASGPSGASSGPGGAGGVGEKAMSLMASITEAIEDVTDSEEANLLDKNGGDSDISGQESEDSPDELDLGDEEGGELDGLEAGGEPVTRFVPGAHLIYKRQSDVDSFEELWIYAVDIKSPTSHAKIERQILAGTDIDPSSMASEDGAQTASVWHAGNAKYMHITGLVN